MVPIGPRNPSPVETSLPRFIYRATEQVYCIMPVAELALAIDACIAETTPVVIKIIETAIEVVHHKEKCLSLGAEAKRLENLLKDKKANLKTLDTVKELVLLIHEIDNFVDLGKTWTILGAAWDTIFKHDYRRLMKRAARIKRELIFEASVRF